jgi:hypothetical protein
MPVKMGGQVISGDEHGAWPRPSGLGQTEVLTPYAGENQPDPAMKGVPQSRQGAMVSSGQPLPDAARMAEQAAWPRPFELGQGGTNNEIESFEHGSQDMGRVSGESRDYPKTSSGVLAQGNSRVPAASSDNYGPCPDGQMRQGDRCVPTCTDWSPFGNLESDGGVPPAIARAGGGGAEEAPGVAGVPDCPPGMKRNAHGGCVPVAPAGWRYSKKWQGYVPED